MSQPVLMTLRETRKLLAGGWTQGLGACDKEGRPASTLGTAAVCFCLTGAVHRVVGGGGDCV